MENQRLQVMPGEQRGDDLGSSVYPSFKSDDLALLVFAYHTKKDGYVETYCLSEESAERLKEIRLCLEDPEWKEDMINVLEPYLPPRISFAMFEKMSYSKKFDIIHDIKQISIADGVDLLQQSFDEVINNKKDKRKHKNIFDKESHN